MNQLHSISAKSGTRPAPLLLAGALLLLGLGPAGGPALAGGGDQRAYPERRASIQRQQAEAMGRLTPLQRQRYFAARQELEQRQSRQRLERLQQAERCLVPARDLAAIERCQQTSRQQAMESRRARQREMAALHERFNLPLWQRGRHGASSKPDNRKGA